MRCVGLEGGTPTATHGVCTPLTAYSSRSYQRLFLHFSFPFFFFHCSFFSHSSTLSSSLVGMHLMVYHPIPSLVITLGSTLLTANPCHYPLFLAVSFFSDCPLMKSPLGIVEYPRPITRCLGAACIKLSPTPFIYISSLSLVSMSMAMP